MTGAAHGRTDTMCVFKRARRPVVGPLVASAAASLSSGSKIIVPEARGRVCNNKLVLILTRHTLARAGLALIGQPPVLDRHEVVTDNGDVVTLRQATQPTP